jgi:hypothetical protein
MDPAVATPIAMTEPEEPVSEPSSTSNVQEGEEDFNIEDTTDASTPGELCGPFCVIH